MSPNPPTGRLRLGVLDQSPVAEGSTGAQALRNSIDLARHVERLGYGRYWVAEHHGGPLLAGASPEALIELFHVRENPDLERVLNGETFHCAHQPLAQAVRFASGRCRGLAHRQPEA